MQQASTEPLTFEKVRFLIQETNKQMKEHDKKLQKLEDLFNGQWGKLIEAMVEGELLRLLKERGIPVKRLFQNTTVEFDDKIYEFDLIAENGRDAVFVEVKTTLNEKDIKKYIEKLKIIKELFPTYINHNIYGAIAYIKQYHQSAQFAVNQGLFAILTVGKGAVIINPPDFKPRKF